MGEYNILMYSSKLIFTIEVNGQNAAPGTVIMARATRGIKFVL